MNNAILSQRIMIKLVVGKQKLDGFHLPVVCENGITQDCFKIAIA